MLNGPVHPLWSRGYSRTHANLLYSASACQNWKSTKWKSEQEFNKLYLFSIKELHGRKFFCRRYQTLRLLRNVPPFVENANSLFCSHRLTNGPPLQRTHPSLKLCATFNIIPLSYGKREISLCPTSMQENNPLSTVHNCLFIIFTVNLQTWSSFPTYTKQGHPIPLQKNTTYWGSTHFIWTFNFHMQKHTDIQLLQDQDSHSIVLETTEAIYHKNRHPVDLHQH